jgi:hypothetical protein
MAKSSENIYKLYSNNIGNNSIGDDGLILLLQR